MSSFTNSDHMQTITLANTKSFLIVHIIKILALCICPYLVLETKWMTDSITSASLRTEKCLF